MQSTTSNNVHGADSHDGLYDPTEPTSCVDNSNTLPSSAHNASRIDDSKGLPHTSNQQNAIRGRNFADTGKGLNALGVNSNSSTFVHTTHGVNGLHSSLYPSFAGQGLLPHPIINSVNSQPCHPMHQPGNTNNGLHSVGTSTMTANIRSSVQTTGGKGRLLPLPINGTMNTAHSIGMSAPLTADNTINTAYSNASLRIPQPVAGTLIPLNGQNGISYPQHTITGVPPVQQQTSLSLQVPQVGQLNII